MSTKTITKRVALATVVALGAGVLSLVTVSSANATVGTANGIAGAANTNPGTIPLTLNVATLASVTGSATNSAVYSANTSVGLVAVSDLAGTQTAGLTQTAVLLNTGAITVQTVGATGAHAQAFTVTGGTMTGTSLTAISGDGTAGTTTNTATLVAISVKPNTGATSMTIRLYDSGANTADVTNPTSGTLVGQIVVKISSSATNGVISVANSGIFYAASGASATSSAVVADDTTTTVFTHYKSGSTLPWNDTNFAIIRAVDAYGVKISSTTGLLTATATNGALVALAGGGATVAAGTQSTAFVTAAQPDGAALAVAAPSAAPLSTVVTIAYNGVTIGTKSFTFTGPITKVTLGAQNKINLNASSASAGDGVKEATVSFADAAGNTIYPTASDASYPTSGFAKASSATVPSLVLSVIPLSGTTGYVNSSAGTDAGTFTAIATYTNVDGSVATSNTVNLSNAGTAVSYTASYDKSAYTPGSIATLSVKFLDSKGNLATDSPNTLYFSNYVVTTSPLITVAGGTLAAAPTTATATTNGVATFTVLTGVDGAYQTSVSLGTVSGLTQTSPATAGFTVASNGTTLNDVLKGIVSLIASINKQIAALAKLVAPAKKK